MSVIKSFQWYTKEEIESKAEELILQVETKRHRSLKPANLAEAVADYLDLGVVWDKIEPDAEGQIAAMILPTLREIVINENILTLRGGFGQSTIAHEIGHWILHIDRDSIDKYKDYLEQPFLCRSVNSQQGIEWQAQYFASCLLMPIAKLQKAQKGRDLTNSKHLYAIADEFGVTLANLRNRLKSLNWIVYHSNCKQIYLGKAAPKA
ncbi:MAG: ImmA/IrrE family metallo-endopeptidase [Hydrococcus sp. Prado102]|nr:ImmA/IrrE family metallo-endopeptidase [Hydrococcus sp. Prado102]